MPQRARAAAAASLVALAVACALAAWAVRPYFAPGSRSLVSAPVDFLAFYCAARTPPGADPYAAEPLRTCEHAAFALSGQGSGYPGLAVPAPLPPFALAALRPIGALPFPSADELWFFLLLAAACVTLLQLRTFVRLPLAVLAAALAVGDALPSLLLGQIVPLVLCALVASAAALHRGKARVAAVLAAATLLEPHIGIAACAALFFWEKRARVSLALSAAALAGLSLAAGGWDRNIEYLLRVVPAQARAEGLEWAGQYGLSALLFHAGMPAEPALRAGFLSYAVMLALSLAIAGPLARKLGSRGVIVLTGPAFALLGGAYIHNHQMAFALPLAALVLAAQPRRRLALAAILVALAVPWEKIDQVALGAAFHRPAAHEVRVDLSAVAGPERLAEDTWAVWVRARPHDARTPLELTLFKLPTWAALLGLVTFASGLALHRPPVRRARAVAGSRA